MSIISYINKLINMNKNSKKTVEDQIDILGTQFKSINRFNDLPLKLIEVDYNEEFDSYDLKFEYKHNLIEITTPREIDANNIDYSIINDGNTPDNIKLEFDNIISDNEVWREFVEKCKIIMWRKHIKHLPNKKKWIHYIISRMLMFF